MDHFLVFLILVVGLKKMFVDRSPWCFHGSASFLNTILFTLRLFYTWKKSDS